MKKVISVVVVILLLVTAVGCSSNKSSDQGSSSSSGSDKKPLIALSQGESGNSWRTTNTKDIEAWAKKSGYDFIWTDGNNDAAKQLSDIQALIAKKPDLLIIAPLQTDAISPAYQMVTQAKIPMITIDRTLNVPPDGKYYKAMIVQDFVSVGTYGAERAVQMLTDKYGEPKGNILEITGTIGASPSTDQQKGIRDVLAKYPNIKIVGSESGNYNRATGRAVMDDFLNKFPAGSVDLLLDYDDDSALGALQAMRDAGRTDLMGKIISKDGLVTALKEVVDGNIDTIYQCPPYFGEVTMDLIGKILNNQPYDTVINVPYKTFDMRDNKKMTEDYYKYLVDNGLDY